MRHDMMMSLKHNNDITCLPMYDWKRRSSSGPTQSILKTFGMPRSRVEFGLVILPTCWYGVYETFLKTAETPIWCARIRKQLIWIPLYIDHDRSTVAQLVVECLTWDLGGRWFEPHRRYCVVSSLSKILYPPLTTGSTQEKSPHD